MKINIKNKLTSLIIGIVLLSGFTGCKEEIDLELPYLFRPVNFNVELNKTIATISWAQVDSAVSYTLQVSYDSLDYSTPVVDTTLTELSFTKELAGDTQFYCRIRANASNSDKNSKFNSTLSFKTPKENLFSGFGTSINTGTKHSAYMTDYKTLTIKWQPGANVTHIILSPADESSRDSLVITANEASDGTKVVSALSNSKWTVQIYNSKILRGTTTGIIEGDVLVRSGENLQAAISSATSNQVILIEGNASYAIGSGSMTLNSNIKLRGLSTTNRPIVSLSSAAPSSAVMFSLGTAPINYIKMENIDFTGYCDGNTTGTKIQYMFNNGTAATVSNLSFTNCILRNFSNTTFRLKNGVSQVIDTLSVNGCIINDIGFGGTYAIVNSNTNDLFKTIIFSNSTIYNFKNSLILRQNQTFSSINISNCTINQGMQDGAATRFLIDANTATVTGTGISISNCIFGQSSTTVEKGAAGIRTTGTVLITGSYYTSDYVDETKVGDVSYSQKGKMTAYPDTSTDLWNNPVSGDFTLKATTFGGKGIAGDLRWY